MPCASSASEASALARAASRPARHFDALDGLRGVAALAVALFHWLLSFNGYLAVDFFLALSGFILAHRYLYGTDRPGAYGFVTARLARLYPMHLYGLLSYALVYTLLAGDIPHYPDGTLSTFLQQLTLTHNVGLNTHGQTWNAPSWSISVEFWLNLAFFAWIGRRTRSLALLLASLVCLGLVAVLTGHLDTTFQNYFQVFNSGLLRGWAAFLLGVLAYRGYRSLQARRLSPRALGLAQAVLLAAAVALFFPRALRLLDLLAPPLFALAVTAFAFQAAWPARLLARLKGLGTISYSIYLNHLVILMGVNSGVCEPLGLAHGPLTPLYLAGLVAYSVLTYRFIEVPGKRLLRRLAPARPLPIASA
ncbi:acyltransferase family protein [Pseudomonas mangiferae]|uniref:Acyltransferase n=1 Tax=Pseudomonas mangiferae TaxID=2593654 RepID=A0A553GTL1_9PSED|nr:acyltransferase [Pseudomonas mangiferae]TRX72858.1 acyltransferase [Pseudomonas mangiferae]